MTRYINIKIFNFQELFLDEKIKSITFEGVEEGELTLLPGHVSIISILENSNCKFILNNNKIKQYKIFKGILYFINDEVKIICDQITILSK